MTTPEILGTIPGWITSGGILTLIGILLRNQVQNRRLGIDKLAAEAVADVSVGGLLATEVKELRDRLDKQSTKFEAALDAVKKQHADAMDEQDRRHRDAMDASERRHEECLKDREGLRGEVSILRDEINGMVRVITQASIDRVVMLGDVVPNDIKDAAARAQQLITKEVERDK